MNWSKPRSGGDSGNGWQMGAQRKIEQIVEGNRVKQHLHGKTVGLAVRTELGT